MEIILNDCDETVAPPRMPVLRLQLVGNQLFLTIARYQETPETSTFTQIAQTAVNVKTLLNSLTILMENEGVSEDGKA